MNSFLLSELPKKFSNSNFLLIVGIGFDERSLSVLKAFSNNSQLQVVGLLNPTRPEIGPPPFIDQFHKLSGSSSTLLGEGCESIVGTIDALQSFLLQDTLSGVDILLDITSLSHELLVAMVGLLASERIINRVTLAYTSAEEYSYNTTKDQQWLSRGVTDIRSVLGFPGLMLPSRKSHLIIMAGFEAERAAEVISRYEPAALTIAYGGKDQSVSEQHHHSNKQYAEEIRHLLSENSFTTEEPATFEFSCIDPFKTCEYICQYISELKGENVVICPLNTKISTVGAALAGLRFPWLQICYAQPSEYNLHGYAKPSDSVRLIPFSGHDLVIGEL